MKGGDCMEFLTWIILGALAGWVASLIMRTNAEQGALMNIVLGIIGAFVGGFIVNLFGAPGVTGFNLYSVLVAILGAALVIGIGKAFLYR